MPRHRRKRFDWKFLTVAVVGAIVVVGGTVYASHRDAQPPASPGDGVVPFTVAQPHVRPVPAAILHGKAILFVGDSITVGQNASSDNQRYESLVVSGLSHHDYWSATLRAQGGTDVPYWMSQPMPTGQNVVVVELGTNDMKDAPTVFARDYRTLIANLRQASPHAQFLCLGTWAPYDHRADALDAAIEQACPGRYVDVTAISRGLHVVSHLDMFHPNDRGHRLIATAVLNALGDQ